MCWWENDGFLLVDKSHATGKWRHFIYFPTRSIEFSLNSESILAQLGRFAQFSQLDKFAQFAQLVKCSQATDGIFTICSKIWVHSNQTII